VETGGCKLAFRLCLCLLWAHGIAAKDLVEVPLRVPEVPYKFTIDMEAAARMRPQLMAQSVPASGAYATGNGVFETLVRHVGAPSAVKLNWQLRIVEDDLLNAYSSPDGTVYVESGLARLANSNPGLWAAILSHEIAHIVHRDWARRYLYQKSLERKGSAAIVLGDPGVASASWADSTKLSEDMGLFCRQLELEADRESLMLMARAGFHPDFVPALHHLLHALGNGTSENSLFSMHPRWEERDQELGHAYVAAGIEFEHRWPEWYASPGGNPPILVFAEEPTVRKTGAREWEVRISMRCQNLAGAVQVVLGGNSIGEKTHLLARLDQHPGSEEEIRQFTGCTSLRTTITFPLADTLGRRPSERTDIYVLDAWGSVLARADIPGRR